MMAAVFWLSAALLAYSLVVYGALLVAVARLRPARPEPRPWAPPKVSFLIAAYNEAAVIAEKLRNTLALDPGGAAVEIVVVSDGSTDGTAGAARSVADPRITVLELGRVGKTAALARGLERCSGAVVVFSDANALLAEGSLTALLRHFADPAVGGVCGQITVADTGDGAGADTGADTGDGAGPGRRTGGLGFSEGLFWRYDQALKRAESRLGGTVSAQGSVYALRRELVAIPEPGYADDFMISVAAVAAGRRLVFEPRARSTEVVTESAGNEMRRRVRSAELSWRSLIHSAHLMNPLTNGWYAWQLISHKLVRRLNPLFLGLLLGSNMALLDAGGVYLVSGLGQLAFYAVAVAGLVRPGLRRFRPVSIASFFVLSHAAMALGFLRYAAGRKSVVWTPAREGA
ncbi:glycosyltransferase family 2 protein [Roseivivax sp. CAU 1761]